MPFLSAFSMEHSIAAKATYKSLLRMTLFPIAMMVFTSVYTIVDGVFVANFAGGTGFAAINLIYPFVFIIGSLGFMVGTGGTAYCSKLLGEKKDEEANAVFTALFILTLAFGIAISVIGCFFIDPLVQAMASISSKTSEETIQQAILYGRILCLGQPICMIQYVFHPFLMAAGKTRVAFRCSLVGGFTNIILDAVFVGLFRWGVAGAAAATLCGYLGFIIAPVILFAKRKDWSLHFANPIFDWRAIGRSMTNGLSEFVTNISASIVGLVYNIQLLRAYGEDGVSAYGIIMYVSFVFAAMFLGYTLGTSPMVSYQYGAKNKQELTNLFRKSMVIILIAQAVMFGLSLLLARPFSKIFSSGIASLEELSTMGLRIYSLAFLMCGVSIFASAFFTSLNNGLISGLISFLRTLVFQIGFVLLLPLLVGPLGIWWSIIAGEAASLILSLFFLIKMRKRYGY